MNFLLKYIKIQDCISEYSGRIASVISLFLIFILCLEIALRYFFNSPTAWGHELSTMLFGAMSVLLGAYTLKQRAHVRTEIVYDLFNDKVKLVCDLIVIIGIMSVFVVFFQLSAEYAYKSWLIKEVSSTSTWHPLMYPIKSMLPIAVGLLILQTISDFFAIIIKFFKPDLYAKD